MWFARIPVGRESTWHHDKPIWIKHFRPPLILAAHLDTSWTLRLDDGSRFHNRVSTICSRPSCLPRELRPHPRLPQMVLNGQQSLGGGARRCGGQAATAGKQKASFAGCCQWSRSDCWRNLAACLHAVYSELHVPCFMPALLSFSLLLEDS